MPSPGVSREKCPRPMRFPAAALALALLVVIGALCLLGGPAFAEKRLRIGIAMPSFRESRWQYDIEALQEQSVINGVDILVRFAGNDQKQQNIHMKELANLGVDLLLVAPEDVLTAHSGIEYAKNRGIPVISYDRLAENCHLDAYVSFERAGVGELMGRFLLSAAPHGKYILLRGPTSDSNSADYFSGAMKYLRPAIDRGDITVLLTAEVAGWRTSEAERLTAEVLKNDKDIAAVLAPNDDTAGGVIAALEKHGLAGKVPVTGQDANVGGLKRIQTGLQSMTVFKNTNKLAARAMQVALALLDGNPLPTECVTRNGEMPVPTYFLPVIFLDKNGINNFLRHVEFE